MSGPLHRPVAFGFGLLAFLAADTRPLVTRAVGAAVRNILKRRPELRDAIAAWDGGQRPIVQRALASDRVPASV